MLIEPVVRVSRFGRMAVGHRARYFQARLLVIDGFASRWIDPSMRFEILGEISEVETFATGAGIREIARLRRVYGCRRKGKGVVRVRLANGSIQVAEIHQYEAAGIGRKEFKIKHLL